MACKLLPTVVTLGLAALLLSPHNLAVDVAVAAIGAICIIYLTAKLA